MSTVTETRTVVVVGRRPRRSAIDVLGDVLPGEGVFVLGLDPTAAQRRLTEDALAMAAERRCHFTTELMPGAPWLEERLRDGDDIRALTRDGEARRFGSSRSSTLPTHDVDVEVRRRADQLGEERALHQLFPARAL
jgi:hypothetical protein